MKGGSALAATRLIALHQHKGKSIAACLKDRTNYAQNPDKTEKGELVSSYQCSPLTVDEEFMLTKKLYEQATGAAKKVTLSPIRYGNLSGLVKLRLKKQTASVMSWPPGF